MRSTTQEQKPTEAPNVNFQGRKCPQCGGRRWYSVWWGFTGCAKCGAEHPAAEHTWTGLPVRPRGTESDKLSDPVT